jgi:hypothetical protein
MEEPNQNYINNLSDGDEIFKQKLIAILKKEFPVEKQVYFDNYNNEKYNLAADNVHKLKHKISILGLEKSYELAVIYEENLLEGNTSREKEFKTVLKTITNYLERL